MGRTPSDLQPLAAKITDGLTEAVSTGRPGVFDQIKCFWRPPGAPGDAQRSDHGWRRRRLTQRRWRGPWCQGHEELTPSLRIPRCCGPSIFRLPSSTPDGPAASRDRSAFSGLTSVVSHRVERYGRRRLMPKAVVQRFEQVPGVLAGAERFRVFCSVHLAVRAAGRSLVESRFLLSRVKLAAVYFGRAIPG